MITRPLSDLPLALAVATQAALVPRNATARGAGTRAGARGARRTRSRRLEGDGGQTTAEYALVLLGAATLALLLLAWATKTDRIGKLLDFVFEQITGRVR